MSSKDAPQPSNLSAAFWLLFTGLGIGWLIGLAISPVVAIVITSVTGGAAALVAALSGLQDKPDPPTSTNNRPKSSLLRWNVDPLPLMVLVIGICLGSVVGIKARNDGWLGTDLSIEVKKWTDAGLVSGSFTKADLVRRLFESRHYTGTTPLAAQPVPATLALFSSSSTECQRLIAAATKSRINADQSLAAALRGSTVAQLRPLPTFITDTLTLANLVEEILCADGSPPP